MKLDKSDGFGLISFFLITSVVTLFFMANVDNLHSQTTRVLMLNKKIRANQVVRLLEKSLNDPGVKSNIFIHQDLDDGSLVHVGTKFLGVQCVQGTRNGLNTPCAHKKIPAVIPGNCGRIQTLEAQKMCWVASQLTNYRAEVLFPSDPTVKLASELVLDNRLDEDGITGSLDVCHNFGLVQDACPFRVELYIWVECSGAVSPCGGTTTVGGTIKAAALVVFQNRKNSAVNLSFRHALVDLDFGPL